ncbi:MAG: nickel-dependent lactate racemase [Lentisphaeria bacterium]|nr:nickel-dependent lactate racemase [Lentisphaeria bacterium]
MLYGSDGLTLRFPHGVTLLRGTDAPPLPDPQGSLREALERPYGCPPLREVLHRRKPGTVVITISDITRPVPNRLLLPPILEILHGAGIPRESVAILIGTGMHRPSTPEERQYLVGSEVLERYRVVDHRADAADSLVSVSESPPVRVCRLFAEADFRIVTGLIEPHFMAGFSGGRKGVCPALVDLRTIERFHGVRTLDDPRAENGVLAGNPCHEVALSVARRVGVDFLCNVAITRERGLAGVYCGELEAAHEAGCRDVAAWTAVAVPVPFDLVVTCGGGYPLDQTLYQTVKGMCTALPAIRPGGALLQVSHCGEGVGSAEYRKLLATYGKDWQRFLRDIRSRAGETRLDQWELQMQCRVLERIGWRNLHLATDGIDPAELDRFALSPVGGDGDARARAQGFLDGFSAVRPGARLAVIPDGPYTLVTAT